MIKTFAYLLIITLTLLIPFASAQEVTSVNEEPQFEETIKSEGVTTPEPELQVGKHVMTNMNATSMIMSLLMVLGLIIISALVLKRFNLTQQSSSQLKVISSLSLGAKERIIVVQVGEEQLVLGVCPQQISLLKSLDNLLDTQVSKPLALSGSILSFLQKNSIKAKGSNDVATNKTTNNK